MIIHLGLINNFKLSNFASYLIIIILFKLFNKDDTNNYVFFKVFLDRCKGMQGKNWKLLTIRRKAVSDGKLISKECYELLPL